MGAIGEKLWLAANSDRMRSLGSYLDASHAAQWEVVDYALPFRRAW